MAKKNQCRARFMSKQIGHQVVNLHNNGPVYQAPSNHSQISNGEVIPPMLEISLFTPKERIKKKRPIIGFHKLEPQATAHPQLSDQSSISDYVGAAILGLGILGASYMLTKLFN